MGEFIMRSEENPQQSGRARQFPASRRNGNKGLSGVRMPKSRGWTGWVKFIDDAEWVSYQRVLQEIALQGIPFALGGGMATATHIGLWQNTGDLDMYVLPSDCERMIRLTERLGFTDVDNKLPYDHSWTYRATDGKVIVEAIWSMRNGRANVDSEWLDRSEEIEILGSTVRVAPVEEMIWHKLYVVMKPRCDWPDVLNYLYFKSGSLDWGHLLKRLDEDKPLLASVLAIFSWISPDRSGTIPKWVWQTVGLEVPKSSSFLDGLRHAAFLSPSKWYAPMADGSLLERSK
jgi:hypothetical protein